MQDLKAVMIAGAVAVCIASAGAVSRAGAQRADAKPVGESQAEQIAIRACHGGTVKSERSTMMHGVPAYAVEVNVAGKAFIEKVSVAEKTGAVLGVTYAGQQA
ncbi:MAG TPA: hypothetical protein VIC55_03935 [Gemmatimonadaceae bacterium]|jgi:hypothetical protein